MVTHKFIAALFVVLVEFRVAKLDTVEIKLGRRNVIIPLNGHIKVKRFNPEEFENLKMSIPDLVELVAKAQGHPPPLAPALPPPRRPLPPDPYQPAPQYEPPYANPSYRRYPQHQVPNYSEAHILRNYPNQPPINSHFSEYPQQENHSEQNLPRHYHPLPYYEYTQPINHPEEAVQGSTQYYPSLYTPNHSHPRPQVTRTENNFRKTVHTTEPHSQTKAINGIHTYKEDIPRRQSPTFHHTDRRIHQDTKIHPQTKASNNNQDYIASHRSHHKIPPNISTWLHDHEILEHIQSEKPVSRSKTRSKNPSPSNGPRQTFLYRDTPTYMSRSTIFEDEEALKVTPHFTSRFKKDNFTSFPKHMVKKKVFTSQPTSLHEKNIEVLRSTTTSEEHKITAHPAGTRKADVKNNAIESHSTLTSKQDVVIPNTLSVLSKNLKEIYTTPHSELTTMNLHFLKGGESTTPKPVDQRTYAYITPDAPTYTSYIQNTTFNSQKIKTDITTDAPVLIRNKKTFIQDTTSHMETFSPEHDSVLVPKDVPEEFITTQPQISQSKTDVQIISSPKHDETTNSQEMHSSMETGVPVSITSEGFRIGELKTGILPISSSEHETAINTQEKYTSSEPNTTDALTENIKDEPRVEDSTTVILTSSFFEHYIAANAPQIYNLETLNAQDRQTDIPVTMSPERDRTSKIKEIVTASNVEQSITHIVMNASAQDIRTESLLRDLTTATSDSLEIYTHVSTDAPALNIALESYSRDPVTDISVTTSLENDTKLNAEETSKDVTTTSFPIHDTTTETTKESQFEDTITDVPTFFEKSETEDNKDIFFHEYDRTTPFRIYAVKRTNELTTNTATELHPQVLLTEVITKDNTSVTLFGEQASVSTNPPASLNTSTKTLVENTTTKLDTGTNPQNINYSTSMNTSVLSTATEPYTKDIPIDIRETSSPEQNTSNVPHVATNEYVLNETGELHIQNSQMNAPPTSSEDDTTTDVEDVFTTTGPSQKSTERVATPLSIESSTETAAPMTPPITTVSTPAPSPSPQNNTTEIDVVAAAKRRTCKHARKKACGGTGKPAKRHRRRRRRTTTRAPQISYPTPAPGYI